MPYFVGLDLGQAADFTALALLEKHQGSPATYDVRHLARFPLGTSYPDIVNDVSQRLQRPPLAGNVQLILDGSGVGRAVVDLFRQQLPRCVPVTITAGGQATKDAQGYWRVAKRDLIGAVQVLLQTERVKIAAGIAEAATLVHELQTYEVRISDSANAIFNAREGMHDDTVLALALACWYAEKPTRAMPPSPPTVSFYGVGRVAAPMVSSDPWKRRR